MSAGFDPIDVERALDALGVPLGRPLHARAITESTNDDAKRAARDGAPAGTAFVAAAQTQGRGRLGRSWHSPPGENLYASFVLRPALDAKAAPLVTLTAGVAVADALAPLVPGAPVSLKWPNDVLVGGRKVAGILSEAQLVDHRPLWIVVGVGVNVRTTSFPPELAARATSLALAGSSALGIGELFVALAAALHARVGLLEREGAGPILRAFAARDALAGQAITVDGAPATALGVNEDGALRVRRPDGAESVCLAGHVEWTAR